MQQVDTFPRALSVGEITRTSFAMMSADGLAVGGAVLGLTTIDFASRYFLPPTANILTTVLKWTIEFFLIRRTVERGGLRIASRAGTLLAFLLSCILSVLGIVLGFVFLLLPGLYLSLRWSIAGPALVARRLGPIEALGCSWEATRDHVMVITIPFLLMCVPAVASFALILGSGIAAGMSGRYDYNEVIALAAVGNLLSNCSVVGLCYLSIAIYKLLSGPTDNRLDEVFA